jgi:hypothetical protein
VSLDPVRRALLDDARRDAAALRASARDDAESSVRAARADADRMVAAARAEGEAEVRAVVATELARARRGARELVLAAQREADERARAEVRRAASGSRDAHDHPALVAELGARARRQLGPSATVTVDEEVGGVVAREGTRSVDYRLPVIAERCFDALGPERDELWR